MAFVEVDVFFEALAFVFVVSAAFERVEAVLFLPAVLAFEAVADFVLAVEVLDAFGFRVVVLAVGCFVARRDWLEVAALVFTATLS